MIGKRDLNKDGQPEYFASIRWLLKKIITYITYNILKKLEMRSLGPGLLPSFIRFPVAGK